MKRLRCIVALALATALGCGGGAGTAPTEKVTGQVTYQGKALAGVSVTFTPAQGRPANGVTDASGKFTLTTFKRGDGAVAGEHKVTVSPGPNATPPPMPGTPEAAKAPAEKPPFPPRYRDAAASKLTATVKKGQANDVKLELTD